MCLLVAIISDALGFGKMKNSTSVSQHNKNQRFRNNHVSRKIFAPSNAMLSV